MMQSARPKEAGEPGPDPRILLVRETATNPEPIRALLHQGGYRSLHQLCHRRYLRQALRRLDPHLAIVHTERPKTEWLSPLTRLIRGVREDLPLIVVSADGDATIRRNVLADGADEYLLLPFDPSEFLHRISVLIRLQSRQRVLAQKNEGLLESLAAARARIERLEIEMVARLAHVVEFREESLGDHNRSVAGISADIARALGHDGQFVDNIRRAARVHDLGKVAVPDRILQSASGLNPADVFAIRRHPLVGSRALAGGDFDLIRMAEAIALTHHERWDGTGYPLGLQGEAIPIEGRIVAVADAFDAMTSDRPYSAARTERSALQELRGMAGRQFDPTVVRAFEAAYPVLASAE